MVHGRGKPNFTEFVCPKKSIKKQTVATTTTDTAGKESTFLDWPRSSLLDQVCYTKIKMCSHAKIQENNTHAQEQKQSTDNAFKSPIVEIINQIKLNKILQYVQRTTKALSKNWKTTMRTMS